MKSYSEVKVMLKSFLKENKISMCRYACRVYSEKYQVSATVTVRHKMYCLSFRKDGETYEDEILPVKREATMFIETLAIWKLEEHLAELAMEETYETLCSEKKR
jgi:hypothetical protein